MQKVILVDRLIEQRDVDAALCLLDRMLGVRDVDGGRRQRLEEMRDTLKKRQRISDTERRDIVAAYREVVG